MRCPRCENEIDDDDLRCPICRVRIPGRKQGGSRKSRAILFIVAFLFVVFLFQHRPQRIPSPPVPSPSGNLMVRVLDVGQGDSILCQFPNGETMLVDAGDSEHGQEVVSDLQQAGISEIDLLVATHPHEDHIGGMADVLAAFPITQVWDDGYNLGSRTQQQFLHEIERRHIRYVTPRAGDTINFGNANVSVLAPAHRLAGTESDANNNSLVLRLRYGKVSFLLTGDMEEEERATIDNWPQATVLKVAHHGSHNGTDTAFIDAVQPTLAVISCGLHNSFGHPHAETLKILREAGITIKNTAKNGTVQISTDGETVTTQADASTSSEVVQQTQPVTKGSSDRISSSTARGQYIGNTKSLAFHRPSCESLPAVRNRIDFASRDAALHAGYHPCGRCRP